MGRALLVLFAVAALALAGCGGSSDSGPETFSDDEFNVTFEYPGEFDRVDDINVASTAGGSAKARKGVGLDDHNLIILTRFDLNIAITESNLAKTKEEIDTVVGQAAGSKVSGERTEAGGMPGYEYRFPITEPVNGESRFIVLFDGKTEYTLNCQSTDEKRSDVEAACAMALETIELKD
ncbi:MAG: hypothetical protein ABR583_11050 [Gaiellaceae bacterium]